MQMNLIPNPRQKVAIEYEGDAVVTARPGSGKTFVLARMIKRESKKLLSFQGLIAISYTNKASSELRDRCERLGARKSLSFYGTIDSFCLGEIVAPFRFHLVGKTDALRPTDDDDSPLWGQMKDLEPESDELKDLVLSALETGELPVSAIGLAALVTLDEVKESREYLAARYTSIFIDEYQDCGYAQHELLKRLVAMGMRAVVVGDLEQAIFQFNQRSPVYLRELMRSERFKHFELTQNYRCDKSIVSYSLTLLDGKPRDIPKDMRRVFDVTIEGDEAAIAAAIRMRLPGIMNKYHVPNYRDIALIGSSNKGLERFASAIGIPFKLYLSTPLDNGFGRWRRLFVDLLELFYSPAKYPGDFSDRHLDFEARGSRRNKVFELVEGYCSLDESSLCNNVDVAIEIARLCVPECESAKDILRYQKTVGDLKMLRAGFRPAQPGEINLLTYHKAKGLEFDAVFCLDTYEFIMPPYKAEERKYDALSQSLAMHYVGITRARKVCYFPLGTIRHNANGQEKEARPSPYLSLPNLKEQRNSPNWIG